MMRNLAIVMMATWSCLHAGAAEKLIATFPSDAAPPLAGETTSPPGVTASPDPAVVLDGQGSIKVVYTGEAPVDVMLFAVEKLPPMDNCVLRYTAALRSEGVNGKAYLAMWLKFPDGNSYFSRGMDQALTGTHDWRRCITPFYLKKGESPVSATLGVRFEGPGTVWVSDLRLVELPHGLFSDPGTRGAVLGALAGVYGALVGTWGFIMIILALLGKAKKFAVVSCIVLLAVGVMLLAAGLCCLIAGVPWDVWYVLLLSGVIDALTLGPILWFILWRYRYLEAQRLHAQDQAENL